MKKALKILGVVVIVLLIPVLYSYNITHKPLARHKLNSKLLEASFDQGRLFLLNNQYQDGSFAYQYNFIEQKFDSSVSQVRQVGALWGLTLVHQHKPTEETKKAIIHGLEFLKGNTVHFDSTSAYIIYPNEYNGSIGTMALASLALIDFLRIENDEEIQKRYFPLLESYINFLKSSLYDDNLFAKNYSYYDGKVYGMTSPYFNGETLLAFIKAAKYMGFDELKPIILKSAEAMYQKHIVEALKIDPDSDETKGFYQWSSMAYFEIYTAGWENSYAQKVIDLAYWMIDVHKTLHRTKNTAYAHEGMIHAHELARLTNNDKAIKKIGRVIDKGLLKLTTWQVKGPRQNIYLKLKSKDDKYAVGGIMNYCCDQNLRIDVTQHQMHAVTLALKYIY